MVKKSSLENLEILIKKMTRTRLKDKSSGVKGEVQMAEMGGGQLMQWPEPGCGAGMGIEGDIS